MLVQEEVERFGYRVHAFCLMTNRIHFLIQAGDIPLSKIMQNLGSIHDDGLRGVINLGHSRAGEFVQFLLNQRIVYPLPVNHWGCR
ncbi:MAG: hypothetical protein ACE5DY_04825 [Mariprofundaceae bacterium]